MSTARRPMAAVELLKLLRSGWHTREQIARALGWAELTVDEWMKELRAHDMVRMSLGNRVPGRRGRTPYAWTLSKEWGGQDHPTPRSTECN